MSISTVTATADGGDFDRWEAELNPARRRRPARSVSKAEAIRVSAGEYRHRKTERREA